MKDFVIFLPSHQKLVDNKETRLTVIDVNTLEHMDVVALVSGLKDLPDADRLWIRQEDLGDVRKSEKPCSIRILQRMADPEEPGDKVFRRAHDRISKHTEFLLTTSEQYLRDIMATTDQWIWEMDADARYTYVSATVEKVLGYRPQDIIGKTIYDFLTQEDTRKTEGFLLRSKHDKAGFKCFPHHKCHRNGNIISVETTGFTLLGSDGALLGWRGVDKDVTRRKEIEEGFRHHQQILAVINTLNSFQIRSEHIYPVLSSVATSLRSILSADKVTIFIPALDSTEVFLIDEGRGLAIVKKKLLRLAKEGGYDGKIFSVGDPTFTSNIKAWRRPRPLVLYAGAKTCRSYMSIPLRGQDGILGVMEFSTLERNGFSRVDLTAMDAIGTGLGLAIERACYCAALQDREKDLSSMSARLVHAQEDERHRISRILHDDVGQFLSSANMILKSVELEPDSGQKRGKGRLEEVGSLIRKAMRRVRDLSFELRPVVLENIGLAEALRHLSAHYHELNGVDIRFATSHVQRRLPENIELALYRVAEEALRNVSKHAKAQHVSMELAQSDHGVIFSVRDDGMGFDHRKARLSAGGLGLRIMEERMKSIGGGLKVISKPNKGTRIVATLSLAAGEGENGDQGYHCG